MYLLPDTWKKIDHRHVLTRREVHTFACIVVVSYSITCYKYSVVANIMSCMPPLIATAGAAC